MTFNCRKWRDQVFFLETISPYQISSKSVHKLPRYRFFPFWTHCAAQNIIQRNDSAHNHRDIANIRAINKLFICFFIAIENSYAAVVCRLIFFLQIMKNCQLKRTAHFQSLHTKSQNRNLFHLQYSDRGLIFWIMYVKMLILLYCDHKSTQCWQFNTKSLHFLD